MSFSINVDKENNLVIGWDKRDFDIGKLIEQLEDKEICHTTSEFDGWSYFYDKNSDLVYHIDDYWFNCFDELYAKGETKLSSDKNTYHNYHEYEWNDERQWTDEEVRA
jgi:hypothetical protein